MKAVVLAATVLFVCAFLCHRTADGQQQLNKTCDYMTCGNEHCMKDTSTETCTCAKGYSGPNCTGACELDEIAQGECAGQACKMSPFAIHGYQCIPDECQYNGTCMENETCARNQSSGAIQCLKEDPCNASDACGVHSVCEFNPLYSNVTCHCDVGYDDRRDCRQKKSCNNETDICEGGGTCAKTEIDLFAPFSCICINGFHGERCELDECDRDDVCGNGTCHATAEPPFYNCSCNMGYTGENCTVMVDACSGVDCNNGTCETDGNTFRCNCSADYYGAMCEFDNPCECVNGGTCDELEKCMCPDGFVGDKCGEVDHCAEFPPPCQNGGTCSNGPAAAVCTCATGYTGSDCSEDICAQVDCGNGSPVRNDGCRCDCDIGYTGSKCQNKTCMGVQQSGRECYNGGTCMDEDTGFICACPAGTTGPFCETTIQHCMAAACNETGTRECQNQPQGPRCNCRPGFTGTTCTETETLCRTFPCMNGGVCEAGNSHASGFFCSCPSPYTGRLCKNRLDTCDGVVCLNRGRCEVINNEAVCNCSNGFSGDDCAIAPTDSTSMPPCEGSECPPPLCNLTTVEGKPCGDVFGDGVCNAECDNEECLKDGFDCRQVERTCPESIRSHCVQLSRNGICNDECNFESCRFDGGECTSKEDKIILPGTLVVVIIVDSLEEFEKHLSEFLLAIGETLNCVAKLGVGGVRTATVSKRQVDSTTKVEVDMKLDVQHCNESEESCVSSVDEAGDVISNLSQRTGYTPAGYTVVSARGQEDPTSPTATEFPLGAIAGIVIGVAIVVVAVFATMAIIKRKRTIRAAVWRPEGQNPSSSTRSSSFDEDSSPAKRIVLGKDQSNKDLRSEAESYPMKPVMNGAESQSLWRDVYTDTELSYNGKMPKTAKSCVVGQELVDANSWHCLHYRALHNQSRVQNCVQRFNRDTDYITDINVRGPGGYTALMIAVMSGQVRREGDDESDTECARPSLLNGHSGGISGSNPLTVKDLLHLDADPNLKNELGQSALHIAAACSRADAARLLLRHRADPNIQDCSGRTPLHVAIASEADGVFQIIIRHKNTNPEAEAEDGVTPLILATQHHGQSMVEQLLKEAHVEPSAQERNGKTALHWAASMNMVGIMRILQKHGANKDAQDNQGQTPLFLAAKEGASDAVRLLLESFANRNIQDSMERTPLRIAQERYHEDIVRMLTDWSFSGPPSSGSQASPHEHSHMNIQVNTGYNPHHNGYLQEAAALAPPPYTPAEPTVTLRKSEKSRYTSPGYSTYGGMCTYSPPESEHNTACRVLPVGSELDDLVGFPTTTTYGGHVGGNDSLAVHVTAASTSAVPNIYVDTPSTFPDAGAMDPIVQMISPPQSYPSDLSSPYQQQRPSSDPLTVDSISPLLQPNSYSSSTQSSPYSTSAYLQPPYPSPPDSHHGNPITPPFESNNGQLPQVLTPPESNSQSPPHDSDRLSPMGSRYGTAQGGYHGQGVGPYSAQQ